MVDGNAGSPGCASTRPLAANVGQCQQNKLPDTWSADSAKCRDKVLPTASERSYRKIPWRRSVLHGVPRNLVQRLACPHLLDVVRGHTAPFPRQAVEKAELTATTLDVKGDRVALSYTGRTRAAEVHDGIHFEGKWNAKGAGIPEPQTRGIDARLEGRAVYDLKAERFVSFELVALGERWGGNAYNGRLDQRDFGPAPIGFVLGLAGQSPAARVAPLFLRYYGWK